MYVGKRMLPMYLLKFIDSCMVALQLLLSAVFSCGTSYPTPPPPIFFVPHVGAPVGVIDTRAAGRKSHRLCRAMAANTGGSTD